MDHDTSHTTCKVPQQTSFKLVRSHVGHEGRLAVPLTERHYTMNLRCTEAESQVQDPSSAPERTVLQEKSSTTTPTRASQYKHLGLDFALSKSNIRNLSSARAHKRTVATSCYFPPEHCTYRYSQGFTCLEVVKDHRDCAQFPGKHSWRKTQWSLWAVYFHDS